MTKTLALFLSFTLLGTTSVHTQEAPPSLPVSLMDDVDLDGRLDMLLVHPSGSAALYRTVEGRLEERLEAFGPAGLPRIRSAAFGDLDSDGAPDLLVVTRAGEARLFANDGAGAFTDVTANAGLDLTEAVLGARWEDADQDGRADLVIATASGFSIGHNLGEGYLELSSLAHAVAPTLRLPATSDSVTPSKVTNSTTLVEEVGAESQRVLTALHGPRVRADGTQNPTAVEVISPLFAGGACAHSLRDALNGGCLEGSATPTLGMLYPMSTNLNVHDVTDRVGIGTTSPGSKLTVAASGESALRATSDSGSAAYFGTQSTTTAALTAEGGDNDRAGQFIGSLEVGYRLPNPLPATVSRVFLDTLLNSGRLYMQNSDSVETFVLNAADLSGNGAELDLRMDSGTTTITLDAERNTAGPELAMFTSSGIETIELLAEEAAGNGAQLVLRKANGIATMIFDAETSVASVLAMRSSNGTETVQIVSEEVAGDGAQIVLRKADGTASIVLDAEQGADGRITTEVLQITGGADLVEGFETGGIRCAPGSVVVIDEHRPGELTLSGRAYDTRVAGVVSGAGGVKPGLSMGQAGALDGPTDVALTGRVFVRCSTENGPVQPGDLLTTSSNPGLAMRATDPSRSFGAVIGKAMGTLPEGEGLVLVLVNLQ